MGRRRFGPSEDYKAFCKHAQETGGGYYLYIVEDIPVEFIRPLGSVMIRVREMKTGLKRNVPFFDLHALNEMQVLAYQLVDDPEDE